MTAATPLTQPPAPRGPWTPGPTIDPAGGVTFRVAPDAHRVPRTVWFHLADFGADTRFTWVGDHWQARIPAPPVARMEYLIEFEYPDGNRAMLTDPANPHRSRGVFGDHSLLEWPRYRRPWWLGVAEATAAQARHDEAAAEARRAARMGRGPARIRELGELPPGAGQGAAAGGPATMTLTPGPSLRAGAGWVPAPTRAAPGEGVASVLLGRTALGTGDERRARAPGAGEGWLVAQGDQSQVVDERAAVVVAGTLHVPANSLPAQPLPLVVVHDGPEYGHLGRLLDYLTILARIDPQLRARVLCLAPVERDRCYSASPAYARALVREMLPQVRATVRTVGPVVGVGASLGALAMLHAAITFPGALGGILAQSGSFFLPRTDAGERDYRFYGRIVRFVEAIDVDPDRLAGLRVAMTCGTGEENLANNRLLARRLARAGVPTTLVEHPDGHNYTGWRDALDPSLHDLLVQLWRPPGSLPPPGA